MGWKFFWLDFVYSRWRWVEGGGDKPIYATLEDDVQDNMAMQKQKYKVEY